MTKKELAQQALNILKDENAQLYNTLAWRIGCLEMENQELKDENTKLKKAIDIIMLWRDEQIYDLIDNLKSQDIQGYEILEEVL